MDPKTVMIDNGGGQGGLQGDNECVQLDDWGTMVLVVWSEDILLAGPHKLSKDHAPSSVVIITLLTERPCFR